MSTFSPIIRVRKFLDRMKQERSDSPRGVKRFPSRTLSGDNEHAHGKPRTNSLTGLEPFSLYGSNGSSGYLDSMDMTPLVEQFKTFSEHFNLKLGENAFSVLPNEAILLIFSFLEVNDVFQARLVCRQWCCFADDNLIWKSLCLNDFGLNTMYGSTWKETYSYLEDLFSDGLWEGMSKWVDPQGFDNEQKTTARLQFLKRKRLPKSQKQKDIDRIKSSKIPSSPVTIHRVDSGSNPSEPKTISPFANSLFKIVGSGVTVNNSSPSHFQIEGERDATDLQTFTWNKHFEKHTSTYKGTIDYSKRTVEGTIDYHDGTTHWKGMFFYQKAPKTPTKSNSKNVYA